MELEEIKVQKETKREEDLVFTVEVGKGPSSTNHKVTVNKEDLKRLSPGNITAAELVEESFKFLLEREPKGSILTRFNLTVIGDYFPEFEDEITNRLSQRG